MKLISMLICLWYTDFNSTFNSPKVFEFYVYGKCQPLNLHTEKTNLAVLLNIHLFLPGQNSYIFQLLKNHVSKTCIIGDEVVGTDKYIGSSCELEFPFCPQDF